MHTRIKYITRVSGNDVINHATRSNFAWSFESDVRTSSNIIMVELHPQ